MTALRKIGKILIFPAAVTLFTHCATQMKIIDKPIHFSEKRIELTREYIRQHYGLNPKTIDITPKIIVLHWTAIDDFDRCFQVFDHETLGGSRPELAHAGQVNVSIQFLVDRDGTVYRLMPETWMARHCIGLNFESIGVENVGGANSIDNLTDAQIRADIQLVRYLKKKYPTIDYLIGHHEYLLFEGHPLWMEKDPNYRTQKVDPGDRFMQAVRRGVADLHLKGPKEILAEKASVNE